MTGLRYSHSNRAFYWGILCSSYRRPPAIRRTVLVKETYIAIVKSSLFYMNLSLFSEFVVFLSTPDTADQPLFVFLGGRKQKAGSQKRCDISFS